MFRCHETSLSFGDWIPRDYKKKIGCMIPPKFFKGFLQDDLFFLDIFQSALFCGKPFCGVIS